VPGGMPMVSATFPAGEVVESIPRLQCKSCAQNIGNEETAEELQEHWKPGCTVSCRTVQGLKKRCAKRQAKPATDRAP
jgi:hypothetical protein